MLAFLWPPCINTSIVNILQLLILIKAQTSLLKFHPNIWIVLNQLLWKKKNINIQHHDFFFFFNKSSIC